MKNNRKEIINLRKNTADKNKDYWLPEEREELADMFHAGYGISEMALYFDRSEIAIVNQLRLMNLFRPGRKLYKKKPKCKCPKCAYYAECDGINCRLS